ncbi:MAG: phosphatase PAP2 family protein [Candidatus Berkelbacteria bacterium]|nr:phosphatase PAP2 family protein [Candidatus Berkelbacteria bacterium]
MSVSRVIVGFHYPVDILVGCVLGIITAWLIWLIKDLVNKWVINPIIFVAKKVKLA